MTHILDKYYISFDQKGINDSHISNSNSSILESYHYADLDSILNLGCGECNEINLMNLKNSLHIDLVDIDKKVLKYLRGNISSSCNYKGISIFNEDITGSIANLSESAENYIKTKNDHESLKSLQYLVDNININFWVPPGGYKYTLIICSLLITQLQANLISALENVFLKYFPDYKNELSSNSDWIKTKYRFTRNLEQAFVDHLKTLAAKDAVLYFSDTVRVCFLKKISDDLFSTEGSWITTKTNRLADYFDSSFTILKETSWNWYLAKNDNNSDARLYDVQAVILRYME